MKKLSLILILVCSLSFKLHATGLNPGLSEIGAGGSNYWMGNIGVALDKRYQSLFFNPAGLSTIDYESINVSYMNLFNNFYNLGFLSYTMAGFPWGNLSFGFSTLISTGIEEWNDSFNIKIGEFFDYQGQFYAAYGYSITDQLRVGATLKLFHHSLYNADAVYFSFDAGIQYQVLEFLTLGASIQNPYALSIKTFGAQAENFDGILKLGVAIKPFAENLVLGFDIDFPLSDFNPTIHIGGEYSVTDFLKIQGGFTNSTFTVGLGFQIDQVFGTAGISLHPAGTNLGASITVYLTDPKSGSSTENKHFYNGLKAYQANDFATAATEFEAVLAENPDNELAREFYNSSMQRLQDPEWLPPKQKEIVENKIKEAEQAIKEGDFEKAAELVKEAEQINPNIKEVKEIRKEIVDKSQDKVDDLMEKANEEYTKGNLEEARTIYSNIVKINPDMKQAEKMVETIDNEFQKTYGDISTEERYQLANKLYQEGMACYYDGNYACAIKKLEDSIALRPNSDASILLERAKLKDQIASDSQQRVEESNKNYTEALEKIEEGNLKDGIAYLQKALELDPNNKEAKESLDKLEQQYSSNIKGYMDNGLEALRDGKYDVALKNFQLAADIDPEYVYNEKTTKEWVKQVDKDKQDQIKKFTFDAEQAMQNSDYETALKSYNEILKIQPDSTAATEGREYTYKTIKNYIDFLHSEAETLIKNGKNVEALEIYKEILSIDSLNKLATSRLAEIQDKIKNESGLKSWKDFYEQGLAYLENRQFYKAKESFDEVLRIQGKNLEVSRLIAECDRNIGEIEAEQKIQQQFEAASNYFDQQNYKDALELLKTVRRLKVQRGDDVAVVEAKIKLAEANLFASTNEYIINGDNFFKNKQYGYAKRQYTIALEEFPSSDVIREKLAKVNQEIARLILTNLELGEEAFNKANYKAAIDYYRQVVDIDIDSPLIAVAQGEMDRSTSAYESKQQGEKFYNSTNYFEAFKAFNQVLKFNINDKDALEFRTLSLQQLKTQAELWQNRGNQYFEDKKFQDAIASFNIVLEVDPKNTQIANKRLLAQQFLDEQKKNLFTEAEQANNQGRYSDALSLTDQLTAIDPDYKGLSDLKTTIRTRQQEEAQRAQSLQQTQLAAINPNNSTTVPNINQNNPNNNTTTNNNTNTNTRPNNNNNQNNNTNSNNNASRPNAENAQKAQELFYQGLTAYRNGNFKEASKIFEQVLKLDPTHDRAKNFKIRSDYNAGK